MPESREYNPTIAETLIVGWLERVLDSSITVIIANQGFGRPQKPFVMVEVLTDSELQDAEQCTGAETTPGFYTAITVERRRATISVRAFGRDSYQIMRTLDRSRHREDVRQANSDAGLEVTESLTPIQNTPNFSETTTEQSRTQDYVVSYAERTTEDDSVRVVQRVIGAGDLEPDNLPVNTDVTAP